MQDDALKTAVRRVTKDWAEIYAQRGDAAALKSLLLGAQKALLWRLGKINGDEFYRLEPGVDHVAFGNGKDCAAQIPDSILRRG